MICQPSLRAFRLTPLSLLLPCLILLPMPSQAAEKPGQSKVETLFDGKTLDGWAKTDLFRPGVVQVVDGQIVMSPGKPMTGITTTRKDLQTSNYELTYETMRLTGKDFFAAATIPVGKSFVTVVNGGWGGNVTGISSINGSDASENQTSQFVEYKNQTWYRFQVRVTDRSLSLRIDGKPVVLLAHRDLQLSTRLETRSNEPLGFATWESTGAIRKIDMRRLSETEIKEIDAEVEKANR